MFDNIDSLPIVSKFNRFYVFRGDLISSDQHSSLLVVLPRLMFWGPRVVESVEYWKTSGALVLEYRVRTP